MSASTIDDRRCRFMAAVCGSEEPAAAPAFELRGFEDEDAILGKDDEPLFRDELVPPCARFLRLLITSHSHTEQT